MQVKYNNEKNDTIQVNTFGLRLTNWETKTCLAIKYFDTAAAVGVHLPVTGSEKEDYPKFDTKNGAIAYIRSTDAKTIYKKGKKVMQAFEETGSFEEFGIPLKRGLIQFAQARDLKQKLKSLTGDVNPDDICLVIYTNMDNDKKTDQYLVHVFNQNVIVKGYSPDEGNYTTERTNTEVWEFLDALNEYSKAMSNGMVHAMKNDYDAKMNRRKFERIAFELAASLGVDLAKSATSGKPSKPGVNWGSDNGTTISNRQDARSEAKVVNAETDEDIDAIIHRLTSGADEE